MCRYPHATSNITSDADSRAIHTQKRAFTARTAAARISSIVWVGRTPKEWVATLKGKHCLWNICLDKYHGACSNELLRKLGEMNDR